MTSPAETNVMEKPDAHHVSGNAAEAAQASEESAATENVSTTSPVSVSVVDTHALSLVCHVLPDFDS